MTREEILTEAMKCVTDTRRQYGEPMDNFAATASIWYEILTAKSPKAAGSLILTAREVAVMMIALKLARISGGSVNPDNWVDIAGYAACGGEVEGMLDD